MKKLIVICLTLAATTTLHASDRKFVAGDTKARVRGEGKIVIKNDSRSISAFRFFGNVREALVTLRSTRVTSYRPFGGVVFNPGATVKTSSQYAPVIAEAARAHGVDPRLVAAVVGRESAWNPNAVSPVGACGLMQLMPSTARYLGVNNIFDARENIFGGTKYLRTLLETFDGDLDLTLAAYNAGPGAVQKYKGVPPYRETRAYVRAVRASYERALLN